MDSYLISDSSCDSLKVMTEYKLIKDAVSGLKSLNDYEMNLLISLIFNQEQLVGDQMSLDELRFIVNSKYHFDSDKYKNDTLF